MRTLVKAWLPVATFLLGAAAVAAADSGPGWVDVEVDGKRGRRAVVAVEGTADRQVPGDLMYVDGYLLPRGSEALPRFRSAPGRLVRLADGGAEFVAAATAVATGATPEEPDASVDGLRTLSDRELARLQGVRLVGWSADLEPVLAHAGEQGLSVILTGPDENAPIPPLPVTTRAIDFDMGSLGGGQGPLDLAPLARLTSLRLLDLGYGFGGVTDLTPLAGLRELRWLDLDFRDVAHPEALAGLVELRALDACCKKGVEDLAFARRLTALREISVRHTRVADLAPLAELPHLVEVGASGTAVRSIAAGPWPSLRRLEIFCAPLDREALETFRAAHPACTVVHEWRPLLLAAIEGVDRVRVRTGGTCHRDPSTEQTIAELTRADEITAFVNAIQLDDAKSAGACMCCGSPTFEFYVAGELKASLGYHHGINLRWAGGAWPGDGPLTVESQDRLAAWLADRGVTHPAEELAGSRRRAAAWRLRNERMKAVLGEATVRSLEAAEASEGDDVAEGVRILEAKVPDPATRAQLAFRLLGIEGPEWSVLSSAARDILARLEAGVVLAAAERVFPDDVGALGVAWWLFDANPVVVAGVDPWVGRAAARALVLSDADDRGVVIQALRGYPTPESVALLRRVLEGMVLASTEGTPEGERVPETRLNIERACESLLALGDTESIPKMRTLAASWSADERARLEEGIRTQLAKAEAKAAEAK
jgi:hypothetical protein